MRKITIEQEVFNKFPTFQRGIIIVSNINNAISNNKIADLLKSEINNKKDFDFAESEYIKSWDEAHRIFGSNPNKFPPSIKSLLKRVSKGWEMPFINSVVALFNYISIKHLLPCGGDDLDSISGNLALGISDGSERFVSLGDDLVENPEIGEVIYFDSLTQNVMCRRWNWRNGDFTKITENSTEMVINIDGINIPTSYIETARDELAELLRIECGAELRADILSVDKKEIELG